MKRWHEVVVEIEFVGDLENALKGSANGLWREAELCRKEKKQNAGHRNRAGGTQRQAIQILASSQDERREKEQQIQRVVNQNHGWPQRNAQFLAKK